MGIVLFFVIFGVVVIAHEFGHFIIAKAKAAAPFGAVAFLYVAFLYVENASGAERNRVGPWPAGCKARPRAEADAGHRKRALMQ